jgi:hypothetical protein
VTAWTLFWLLCAGIVLIGSMYRFAREERASRGTQEKVSAGELGLAIPEERPKLPPELGANGDQRVESGQTSASRPTVTQAHLRELMGVALTTPTPEAILEFSAFASRLHRLGPYNVLMVYTQRPGARAVASRSDWAAAGQTVRPDAIPILILRPGGPIMQVFELEDSLPQRDKDPRRDAFAAIGTFREETLKATIDRLSSATKRNLRVEVDFVEMGSGYAGWVSEQPRLPLSSGGSIHGEPDLKALKKGEIKGHWRVMLNRRLKPAEQFATLLHELGHLFCGHVGAFDEGNPLADEYGWPDRRSLPYHAKEVEAELVAWHICQRWGLVTGSAVYLRPHMERAPEDMRHVDLDRVIRAIAKVEHYIPRVPPAAKGACTSHRTT